MPWGSLFGSGLFDQDMIVIQPDGSRTDERGGNFGGGGATNERLHRRYPRPVAEIFDEGPIIIGAGPLAERRWISQHGLDGRLGLRDVFGVERASYAHRSIAVIVAFDVNRSRHAHRFIVDQTMPSASMERATR